MKTLKPIIGIEVHIELKTASKMFCPCSAWHFQVEPNIHTCPVCLGLPGALPVPNKKAIEWCLLIGKALNCTLNQDAKFDRKNYFYPDLAKGYQISQYDKPFCEKGQLSFTLDDQDIKIGIERVHMEEDTGKLIHQTINNQKVSLIDFNRSGVPLVEIVTRPDLRSANEAVLYLKTLQSIVRYLGVSDCDMEKGSMRCEVNISLTEDINVFPKYKVEVKNINSFRFVKKAIEYEIKRQTKLLNQDKLPVQETRGYSEATGTTVSQRSKEEAQDYRYFPEPDIPPIYLTSNQIRKIEESLPELPYQKQQRFKKDYQLSQKNILFLTGDLSLASYFDRLAEIVKKDRQDFKTGKEKQEFINNLANLIVNKKVNIKLKPQELIAKIKQQKKAKISDKGQLEAVVVKVIQDNPRAVADFNKGKENVLGFLLGQVMKETRGQANAKLAEKIIIEKLKAEA